MNTQKREYYWKDKSAEVSNILFIFYSSMEAILQINSLNTSLND